MCFRKHGLKRALYQLKFLRWQKATATGTDPSSNFTQLLCEDAVLNFSKKRYLFVFQFHPVEIPFFQSLALSWTIFLCSWPSIMVLHMCSFQTYTSRHSLHCTGRARCLFVVVCCSICCLWRQSRRDESHAVPTQHSDAWRKLKTCPQNWNNTWLFSR